MIGTNALTQPEKLELLEDAMLDMPQVECPVAHYFGPGVYVREVTIPAGTLAMGHEQRYEHLNIMIKGAVMLVNDDGVLQVMRAPMIFTGKPGRKFGFALEDTVWQNIYATDETDIDKLESTYLNKSLTWQEHSDSMLKLQHAVRQADRDDFEQMLKDVGVTADQVREQSENEADQIPFTEGAAPKVTIRPSQIHGRGVFVSSPVKSGEVIGPARLYGMRTPLGRYTNHSRFPNAAFYADGHDVVYLVALRDINGCVGGDQGEEITVDYRQAVELQHYLTGGQ